MKLNFWQIIGIILLVIGAVFIFRSRMSDSTVPIPSTPATTSTAL